ncbi:MAG: hypothetical protein ACFNVM_00495 [Neisseria elongata]
MHKPLRTAKQKRPSENFSDGLTPFSAHRFIAIRQYLPTPTHPCKIGQYESNSPDASTHEQ